MENSEYVVLNRESYDDLKAEIGELQVDLQIANDKLDECEKKIKELTK
jgi:DNA-binding SARP family transcriptional activator